MKTVSDNTIFAFVLMPIQTEFDDIYKFGIKETAKALTSFLVTKSIVGRLYRF